MWVRGRGPRTLWGVFALADVRKADFGIFEPLCRFLTATALARAWRALRICSSVTPHLGGMASTP